MDFDLERSVIESLLGRSEKPIERRGTGNRLFENKGFSVWHLTRGYVSEDNVILMDGCGNTVKGPGWFIFIERKNRRSKVPIWPPISFEELINYLRSNYCHDDTGSVGKETTSNHPEEG